MELVEIHMENSVTVFIDVGDTRYLNLDCTENTPATEEGK